MKCYNFVAHDLTFYNPPDCPLSQVKTPGELKHIITRRKKEEKSMVLVKAIEEAIMAIPEPLGKPFLF